MKIVNLYNRRIDSVVNAVKGNWEVCRIKLENGLIGDMDKLRFTNEAESWQEDETDKCLLLPSKYQLSSKGNWYVQKEVEYRDNDKWDLRVDTVVLGLIEDWKVFKITLVTGQVGYIDKDRFELEAEQWPEDKDGVLLLPSDYRLSYNNLWYKLGFWNLYKNDSSCTNNNGHNFST